MNLLDSLLDAIVRLEGDALVMHVGEKPYVVTTSAPLTVPRGPLSWGQVELSSRVLTLDAVLGMLGQILPLDLRHSLEEIGAVEYEIPATEGTSERFSVVAARGGDDVWLEVRRRPQPQPVTEAAAEPASVVTNAPPVPAEVMVTSTPAAAPQAPLVVPAAASTAVDLVIEPDEEEDEGEAVEISLDSVSAVAEQPSSSAPAPFEVVNDISQSAPTDDEVDALLASMAPAAAVTASTPSVQEPELEVLLSLNQDEQVPIGADEPVRQFAEATSEAAADVNSVGTEVDIPLVLEVPAAEPTPEIVMTFESEPAVEHPREAAKWPVAVPARYAQEPAPAIGEVAPDERSVAAEPAYVAWSEAEAPVEYTASVSEMRAAQEPPTSAPVPVVASSAIAEARAAFEAFTLTAPEPLSQAPAIEEPTETVDSPPDPTAIAEVLPFDVVPADIEAARPPMPAPSVAEALPPAARPQAPTAAQSPPAIAAEAPTVAETLALAAAAAALDAAAAAPVVATDEAAEPSAAERAPVVQDRSLLAVSQPVVAAPDVRAIETRAAATRPQTEPPAQPLPAVAALEAPEIEAPAAAATASARSRPESAREVPAVTAEETRPALVVPISRSPVRPETPASVQAPAASLAPLEHMLRIAAARGASTVYVVAQSKPMIRVDGEISVLDSEPMFSIADVERVVMDLAPARGRDVQAGPVEWMSDVPEVGRVRCVTFRDHRGPGVIFRMIPPRAISADQLGLSPEVQALCALPDGLVLVAGARASGKSTLLSAFIDLINRTRSDHVISIESQITFVHESRKSFVSQREVRGDAEAAAAAVRSAFREDPDVLVIEDVRTAEIASVAIEAAESGRLVLGSLSAPSTVAAIERLVELFSPERRAQVQTALAGALRGVVAQVLLRKMKGGRIAAREVLLNTPAVASLILENRMFQLPVALEAGRRHGMVPLNDSLAALVRDGTVHVAEAYRKALDREALLPILKRDGIDTSFAERLA